MALIKWRDSYSVGVEKFDEEHKVLVKLINELYVIVRDKGNVDTMSNVVAQLIYYTETHFADEEEAMKRVDYPLYGEHKAIHADLLQQVTGFQDRMEHEGKVIRTDLYQFLRKWLLDHILDEDMKYGDYLKDA